MVVRTIAIAAAALCVLPEVAYGFVSSLPLRVRCLCGPIFALPDPLYRFSPGLASKCRCVCHVICHNASRASRASRGLSHHVQKSAGIVRVLVLQSADIVVVSIPAGRVDGAQPGSADREACEPLACSSPNEV